MKVLLSGASSFTGFWFGKALAEAGHEVTGLFRGSSEDHYQGTRLSRVSQFAAFGERAFGCDFGSARFLDLVASQEWDIYGHHASDVSNYRSPDFDPLAATQANTLNLPAALLALQSRGCHKIVVTGSVFERGEGAGSEGLPHISRYGLSKALSWEIFHFECLERGFHLGKFVIPNPFGPLEEPRFTNYLVQSWKQGQTPSVRTPDYVRDNIHVSLLALEYLRFLELLGEHEGLHTLHPSGYVESQGQFARRFAQEFQQRSSWDCPVTLDRQTDFSEPRIRINFDSAVARHPDWCESKAWDDLVEYYLVQPALEP